MENSVESAMFCDVNVNKVMKNKKKINNDESSNGFGRKWKRA